MKYQRYEIAGLVERPSWWKVRVEEIEEFCKSIKKGKCTVEAKTPLDYPVYQVVYNDYPDSSNKVNWMSVISAMTPDIFGNKEGSPQTIMISGGIHGAEIEGVILVLNLISLLETGYAFLETIFASGEEMLFCDRKNWKTLNAQLMRK